ncbi:NAD-dependent epimerase/dehydratase family protein [Blautia massiliensis (ex Durand et al. 2017)]|uniref:NAD-dependent epimerase/dehydratase family protein n=1 Tax=Blautia massiliensis (ex Durand et al. 2017) TaxID=1737424 RepID=UPI0022E4D02F|nr:NAD-dependent epimerase/dehydratase family protein [Blautia massiliensis (ex Durand et al. 2017)]
MWLEQSLYQEDMEYILQSKFFDWNLVKDSTILVTGGTGLIGSTLINSLVYANIKKTYNIKILSIVRDIKKAERMFFEQIESQSKLKFIEGSMENIPGIEENIDYIIHCASPTASSFFVEHPVETIKTAVEGTINILELAKSKKVKGMVYLSSMEIYGKVEKDETLQETELGYIDPLNVRNCYPESKRICENLCASYAAEYQVPVYQIRLAQTFGPGIAYEDKRVFAMMARNAIEGKDIILQTKGDSKHPYVYTAQAATAIFTVLLNGNVGESYNVSNPVTYCSIYEMGKLVAEKLTDGKIKVKIAKDGDVSKYPDTSYLNLDITKIEKLGWKPEYDLLWMYDRLIKTM